MDMYRLEVGERKGEGRGGVNEDILAFSYQINFRGLGLS